MTQGPKTPSPEDKFSLDDEKISPSENSENPRSHLQNHNLATPELNQKFDPYKNRTQVRQTPDSSTGIAERFPLDANL